MPLINIFQALDTVCVSQFGVVATFNPKDNSGLQQINGIISPPPMLDQVMPGSSTGVTNVYFFVNWSTITPSPARGDVLTLSGVSYDIDDVQVDSQGGALLKLRRNS